LRRYTDEELDIIKLYAKKHSRTSDENVAKTLQKTHFPDRSLQGLISQISKYRVPNLFSKEHSRKEGKPAVGDIVVGYQQSTYDEYLDNQKKVTLWITTITKDGYIFGRILTKKRKIDQRQSYIATRLDHTRRIKILRKNVDYTEV
jgi:hypothetical protein